MTNNSTSSMQNNLTEIEKETIHRKRLLAQERDNYYDINTYVINNDLRNLLEDHNVSTKTANQTLATTIGTLVNAFLDDLCSVYDRPVHIALNQNASKSDNKHFTSLMNNINIDYEFNSNIKKMKLHNTIITKIGYNKYTNKIYLDNSLNEGNTRVWTFINDYYDWEVIAYEIPYNDDIYWSVFDRVRKEQYILGIAESEPSFNRSKSTKRVTGKDAIYFLIGDNKNFAIPNYNPYVIYRNKKQSEFWGYGFNELISFAKSLNLLLSVTNRDTITETLRYAVANFKPKGNNPIKAGASNPIYPSNNAMSSSKDPKIDITSADLYNKDISEWMKTIFTIISNLLKIQNPFAREVGTNMSGIALLIRNQPKIDTWFKDVAKVKKSDIELITNICKANNIYDKKNHISPSAFEKITIEYQKPSIVTDEVAAYELYKKQVTDGNTSPLQWIIDHNKGISKDKAQEMINNNLLLFNELYPKQEENNPTLSPSK